MSAQVGSGPITSYLVPREFGTTTGTLGTTRNEARGEETVKTPAGEFRARHQARTTGRESSDWWLHPQLGVPVRGKTAGGLEYILTSLELPPK